LISRDPRSVCRFVDLDLLLVLIFFVGALSVPSRRPTA
jgi:hypothetical protein